MKKTPPLGAAVKWEAMQGDVFGLVGATLEARYRIDAQIGEGGFGVVYRGLHLSLQRPIAVKCLKVPPHFSPQAREAFFAKFREEGLLLSRLHDCPGIVHVYDSGVTSTHTGLSAPYLVLEWLEGQTLEAHLAQRRAQGLGLLSIQDALALLAPAFDALAFAHRMKVAHRDIKPANLFLASTARGLALKVLDFGIAKAMQEGDSAQQAATGTGSGFQAFSPQYGAPEQFFSRKYGASGPWTDVHALALVLVEMVTGRHALQGADMAELLTAATAAERPTPRRCGLWAPDPIEAVFERALAISAVQRYQDAEQLYEAFRAALFACGLPAPGPLPSLQSTYGPPPGIAPIQPRPTSPSTPALTPVAVGVWQQPALTPTSQTAPGPGFHGGTAQPYHSTTPHPTSPQQGATALPVGPGYTALPGGPPAATQLAPPQPPPPPAAKAPALPMIAGGLALVLGGLGVLGAGAWWVVQRRAAPGATSGASIAAPAPTVELGRWVELGREPFLRVPLTEGERTGRWHFRLTREQGRPVRLEKIRPDGQIAEEIRFRQEGQTLARSTLRYGVESERTSILPGDISITTLRSGEVIDQGCSKVQLIYGSSGDIQERRCLSPTGVLITDAEGCPVWRFTQDGDHRRTSMACFQAEEGAAPRPSDSREGYHLVRYQHDGAGARVKEQYFDWTGAPSARLTDGCYGLALHHDAAGNLESETCLDSTGAPRARRGQQVATIRNEYNSSGCVVRQTFLVVTGVPSRKGEISEFRVVPDPSCRPLRITLHNAAGALIQDPAQGEYAAQIEREFDARGDEASIRCWNNQLKPVNCSGSPGEAGSLQRWQRDDRGRPVSWKGFLQDGRPTALIQGSYPHEMRMTYGEDGRVATRSFLDEQGNAATALGSVGRMNLRYDALGGLVSESFFGVTGRPVEATIGCHEVRYLYDARHRLTTVECRSTSGDLQAHKGWINQGVTWPTGAARMTVERGEPLVNHYTSPEGRTIKRIECRKAEQLCYR
jgi:serine/threonine protein kinase